MDSGRLTRGRSYARQGQVLSIEETRDGIAAKVQGSRATPYKIKIQISPLIQAELEQVFDALAEQAIFTAQLLAGEMPQDIETAFERARVSLFPAKRTDLKTDCSCPDLANPCRHIAATHYILGERFDEDPFLIFRLRGKTQEQVMAAPGRMSLPKSRKKPKSWSRLKSSFPTFGSFLPRWKDSPFRFSHQRLKCPS